MSEELIPGKVRARWFGVDMELLGLVLPLLFFVLALFAALAFGGWWWSGMGLMLLLCLVFMGLEARNHFRRFRSTWIALEATPEFGPLFQALRFMIRELFNALGIVVFGVLIVFVGIAVALFVYSSRSGIA